MLVVVKVIEKQPLANMTNIGVWKLAGFCALAGISSFALVYFILSLWHCDSLKYQWESMLSSKNFSETTEIWGKVDDRNIPSEKMQRVIDQQRKRIREIMKDYKYPRGKYNMSAETIEDLLIEENGKPMRNIVLSTWRSGSTFLSEVIATYPQHYYHFEPLLDFGIVQIRGPPLAAEALTRVKDLLNCDYSRSERYIENGKIHPVLFNDSSNVWKICETEKDLCDNYEFLNAMCRLHPFQLMKLLRLTLNVAQDLLADEKLAVRMVFLVRDPRGTVQSRKSRSWCPGSRDCSDPALLCADLAADYKVAVKLRTKYPTTFRVIRYEDLSAEPYERVEELANFFGTDFHPEMKDYLDTHTKLNYGGPYSTYRDSKQAPYHWKTELQYEEVEEIQRSCAAAMEYWGYVPAMNASHQRTFNPVTNYTLE